MNIIYIILSCPMLGGKAFIRLPTLVSHAQD